MLLLGNQKRKVAPQEVANLNRISVCAPPPHANTNPPLQKV